MNLTRPAKSTACQHLADILSGQWQYPVDLARKVADTVTDPAQVRRDITTGALARTPQGIYTLHTRAWLPALTAVVLNFDHLRLRESSLLIPEQPPTLQVHPYDLQRDVHDIWGDMGHWPDNREALVSLLSTGQWAWEPRIAAAVAPVQWVSRESGNEAPTVTVLDRNSALMGSARDLVLGRLRDLGADDRDLRALFDGSRDALRRAVDLMQPHLNPAAPRDPGLLLSVPVTLHLGVDGPTGSRTVLGLGAAIVDSRTQAARAATARAAARFRTGGWSQDPAADGRARALLHTAITAGDDAAAQARARAILDWLVAPADEPALAYRCANHRDLPTTCTCPDGPCPASTWPEDVDPACLVHEQMRGCARSECAYLPLSTQWSTKVAWLACLASHPQTRVDDTPAQAAATLIAAVNLYAGFDSTSTVEQVAALIGQGLWTGNNVPIEGALTSLHDLSHAALDSGADPITVIGPQDDQYAIAHLLGAAVAIERGLLGAVSTARAAAALQGMWDDPAGRLQLVEIAVATVESRVSSTRSIHPTTLPAYDRLGHRMLDSFGADAALDTDLFITTWLVPR